MPYRKILLAQDQIYHIFNRGVARLPIFSISRDYIRFLNLMDYYRFIRVPLSFSHLKKLIPEDREKLLLELKQKDDTHVEIFAFCLMPNHFHLLLRQNSIDGITSFMKNLQNGYAKYYNIKHDRVGPLFQSIFKAVRVETDEQLLHVFRYIHLNPSTGYLVEARNLLSYPWFSLPNYLSASTYEFVNKEFISSFFKSAKNLEEFVLDQIEYQRSLDRIKHLLLE